MWKLTAAAHAATRRQQPLLCWLSVAKAARIVCMRCSTQTHCQQQPTISLISLISLVLTDRLVAGLGGQRGPPAPRHAQSTALVESTVLAAEAVHVGPVDAHHHTPMMNASSLDSIICRQLRRSLHPLHIAETVMLLRMRRLETLRRRRGGRAQLESEATQARISRVTAVRPRRIVPAGAVDKA
jgi:hypothetical protein